MRVSVDATRRGRPPPCHRPRGRPASAPGRATRAVRACHGPPSTRDPGRPGRTPEPACSTCADGRHRPTEIAAPGRPGRRGRRFALHPALLDAALRLVAGDDRAGPDRVRRHGGVRGGRPVIAGAGHARSGRSPPAWSSRTPPASRSLSSGPLTLGRRAHRRAGDRAHRLRHARSSVARRALSVAVDGADGAIGAPAGRARRRRTAPRPDGPGAGERRGRARPPRVGRLRREPVLQEPRLRLAQRASSSATGCTTSPA